MTGRFWFVTLETESLEVFHREARPCLIGKETANT